MKRIFDWLFDMEHPLRVAFVCLAVAVGNAYEVAYIDSPNGFMRPLSWVFAGLAIIGFLLFLVVAVSAYASRSDGQGGRTGGDS